MIKHIHVMFITQHTTLDISSQTCIKRSPLGQGKSGLL